MLTHNHDSKPVIGSLASSLVNSQRGASVSGVVFIILTIGIFLKLAVAILPAQVGNYQFEKTVAQELKKANNDNESPKEFMSNLSQQLSLNADYSSKPEDMLRFTNEQKGNLAVHTKYEVVNNFFGNVDIVNRFEKDITMADAE
ncbi:DUF4845 domain-containing protein [Psychrobacter sp. I-STPA10]|uniref:DUF4845 domain-containing protein n=1 Tax=Psychrobacter sp. I-STPA10 TaxID=2585769 RepID=UPI001E5A0363|nr:DUF4845 domain-containing protein [Psychrobacter sp. I-STPA10]